MDTEGLLTEVGIEEVDIGMDIMMVRKAVVEHKLEDHDIHYFMEQSGIKEALEKAWLNMKD